MELLLVSAPSSREQNSWFSVFGDYMLGSSDVLPGLFRCFNSEVAVSSNDSNPELLMRQHLYPDDACVCTANPTSPESSIFQSRSPKMTLVTCCFRNVF